MATVAKRTVRGTLIVNTLYSARDGAGAGAGDWGHGVSHLPALLRTRCGDSLLGRHGHFERLLVGAPQDVTGDLLICQQAIFTRLCEEITQIQGTSLGRSLCKNSTIHSVRRKFVTYSTAFRLLTQET